MKCYNVLRWHAIHLIKRLCSIVGHTIMRSVSSKGCFGYTTWTAMTAHNWSTLYRRDNVIEQLYDTDSDRENRPPMEHIPPPSGCTNKINVHVWSTIRNWGPHLNDALMVLLKNIWLLKFKILWVLEARFCACRLPTWKYIYSQRIHIRIIRLTKLH